MNQTRQQDTTIEMTRVYAAPRDRVFQMFTDPELLKQWYAPVDGWVVSAATVDLRVGGGWHLEFGPPGEEPIVEDSEYMEIAPGERLVYRLRLTGRTSDEGTTVTVEFADVEGGTDVSIIETGYSSREVRDMHKGGFTRMLDQLAKVV